MPSAEEPYITAVHHHQDAHHRNDAEVDFLVFRIKENLRLSGLKAKSSVSRPSRPSPYRIPSRSWGDVTHYEHRHRGSARDDDPYEQLQELLREGNLIKIAVKRLQQDEDEAHQEKLPHRPYRRKQFFYDSEDEPLPPAFQSCL